MIARNVGGINRAPRPIHVNARNVAAVSSMKARLFRGAAQTILGAPPLYHALARGRRNGLDAALDRQLAAVLEAQRLLRMPPLDSMAPVRARAFAEEGLSPLDLAPAPMAEITDTAIAGRRGPIAVRIYVPPGIPTETSPWIVYFHGGGGVIGSIRASEPATRWIAARTRCVVASVDYGLGPEHRHPAAIDDACAAWDALVACVPNARVAVAGDSFGGYLSAHVDRYTRTSGARRPDLQVLIYPATDLTHASPSVERYADGYLLTRSMIDWFQAGYLNPADDRRALSPLFWDDVRGAAPAIVVTAGFDPLVDEGDRYADKLRAAGNIVEHHRHASLIHGFLSLAGGVVAARTATGQLCDAIRTRLRPE